MLQLISAPVANPDLRRPEVALNVERHTIAKRLWRGVADDGAEFGFELATPLKSGDTFWQSDGGRYVVRQAPEAVLAISLDMAPSAVAGIGWAIGNLHLELSAEATRLLAPDEPAVRQLLARLSVPFTATSAVFRPGRFNRSGAAAPAELGTSHKH